jgi:hypothetical protein
MIFGCDSLDLNTIHMQHRGRMSRASRRPGASLLGAVNDSIAELVGDDVNSTAMSQERNASDVHMHVVRFTVK